MSTITRKDVATLADAWADRIEGHASAPQLAVRFTPAGLLAFMDLARVDVLEATVEPGAAPVSSPLLPPAPDSLLRRIEAREPSVGLVGATEAVR